MIHLKFYEVQCSKINVDKLGTTIFINKVKHL